GRGHHRIRPLGARRRGLRGALAGGDGTTGAGVFAGEIVRPAVAGAAGAAAVRGAGSGRPHFRLERGPAGRPGRGGPEAALSAARSDQGPRRNDRAPQQPGAQVAPRGSVERVLQPDGAAFSVHFTVEGGARMRWMMHVTQEGATLMGGLLLGSPMFSAPDHGGFMYESALAEMSNIVVSSYVGGVAAAVGLTLVPSIPYVGKALSETMDAAFGDLDSSLLLVTDLRLPGVRYAGRIVAAPVD